MIGQNVDLTYPYEYLGAGAADLGKALADKEFMKSLKEAKYPMVLVGPGILQREDRDQILQQVRDVCIVQQFSAEIGTPLWGRESFYCLTAARQFTCSTALL